MNSIPDEENPVVDSAESSMDETSDSPVEVSSQGIDPEDLKRAFEDLLQSAIREDRQVRDTQIRSWKRLQYYWDNILDIFADPITGDWRIPNWDELKDEVPPRLINIYRPHGEAIVAALSVTVPSVFYHPDDADNSDDVEAAKAYRTITDLLQLHNEAPMLFIRAIVILFNQGTVFGYNYYHEDPKFGTLAKPNIEFKDIAIYEAYCPECGEGLDAGTVPLQTQQGPGGLPQGQAPASGLPDQPQGPQLTYQCQNCGYQGPAEVNQSSERLPQIVGFDHSPKGSICQELFSGLNVKIPAYAKKQSEIGYLLLSFVQSTAMLRSIFPDQAEKINGRQNLDYEGFSRLPSNYYGQIPENAANVDCLWVRPWQFWDLGIGKKDLIQQLTKAYPDGAYGIFIDNEFIEAHDENMDEHWTVSANPMGTSLYSRPLGENLATVQDIRAQLTEISLETAEYGIPEMFADPGVLDFTKYGEGRAKPGMVTKAKARPGKALGDGFYTTNSAVLSQEIEPLRQQIDQDAQFVSAAVPSVYGGQQTGGSKTAQEYTQSRTAALQRLGTTYKILCSFWSQFQGRSATEYASVLKELNLDEKFTKREGNGNFVNVWIRNSSLAGKVGRVEPESSDQLPFSWAQKKDAIQQLLLSNIPQVIEVLTHPRNAEVMKEAIGLQELYIPGEEDRNRQFKEFQILSQGIPVQTHPEIDNAEIHIEVLKDILEGPLGEELDDNAKQACLMHLQEHQMQVQQMQMQAQQNASVGNNSQDPNKPGKAPVAKPKVGQNGPGD